MLATTTSQEVVQIDNNAVEEIAGFQYTIAHFFDMSLCSQTRQKLSDLTKKNKAVLSAFDRGVLRWNLYETADLKRLLTAIELAAELHIGQARKDAANTPYIAHPIGVAVVLSQEGKVSDVDVIIAAVLHDTLEDTTLTAQELEERFGPRVRRIVEEVTNDPKLSTEENKQRQVDHVKSMSYEARLVKLADRLYNIRDLKTPPASWSEEKVDAYYGWGRKLLTSLKGTHPSLEEALEKELRTHSIP